MKKRVLAIINPISGTKNKTDIPKLIGKAYNYTDFEVFIIYTKYPNHGEELAREAVEKEFDIVISVGGDGTINEVARGLLGSNVNLGIIPLGSGNGLARSLDISMNQRDAINNLIHGEVIRIDTCSINGNPFFCTTGMGFDAEVSQRFAKASKRGPITYAINMIKEYINYKPEKYIITIDEKKKIETKAFVIAVANASQYGNDAYIAPKASLTDGLLDLIILEPFSVLQMPKVVFQLFTKKLEKNIHQTSIKAQKIIIERKKNGCIHLDGDPRQMPSKLEIGIIPKSLNVIIPKTRL